MLANVGVHSALIRHSPDSFSLALVGAVGDGGPIFWIRPTGSQMTIGIVTGVPGQDGGITTASSVLDRPWTAENSDYRLPTISPGGFVNNVDVRATGGRQAVVRFKPSGNADLVAVITVRNGSSHELRVEEYDGVQPTFDPTVRRSDRIVSPGADVYCPSISAGLDGRVLLSYGEAAPNIWPRGVLAWRQSSGPFEGFGIAAGGVPVSTFGAPLRVDYCPHAARFVLNGEYLGIGMNTLAFAGNGPNLRVAQQLTAFFCKQKGESPCSAE